MIIGNIHVTKGFQVDPSASINLIGRSDGVGDCANCNGSGYIVSTAVVSGPYDHQPTTGKGRAAVLGKDGWYVGDSKTSPCPICNGDREELVRILIEHCGVPMEDRAKGLGYYKNPGSATMVEILGRVIEELPACSGFITLFGPRGTGKTTAAQIVVLAACRAGVQAMYMTSRELAIGVKSTWRSSETSEEEYMNKLAVPRLLVIDEVDRIIGQDMEHVRAVVDMRYRLREKTMTILVAGEEHVRDEYLRSRIEGGLRIPMT